VKFKTGDAKSRKKGEKEMSTHRTDEVLQLLLPRCEVNKGIELCHAGSIGGHFGIQKTIAQVERRFFWPGWRSDVKRYCRSCEECIRYHRGELPKHGPLKPVLAGAPYERWYIDLTGPHAKSLNMLVLGRETRAPPDLVYGSPTEEFADGNLTYDRYRYVKEMRDKTVQAFHDVRVSLQKSVSRNKKYYDLGLKQQKFAVGEWVLYFNPRKLREKQMKWVRQFEGPFLVVSKPTSLTAKIQRSQKAQIRVVHIDKLKHFNGTPPKAWKLPVEEKNGGESMCENSHLAAEPNVASKGR